MSKSQNSLSNKKNQNLVKFSRLIRKDQNFHDVLRILYLQNSEKYKKKDIFHQPSKKNMIQQFLLVFGLLFILAFYINIIKPYLIYRKYKALLTSLGYKTFVHPFRPLGAHFREMMVHDRDTYGDIAKSLKEVYPHFDVGIGNIHNEAMIEIINPDLIKQFYRNANQNSYIKADVVTSAFKMLVKHGILMKEGQEWKQRKKIISSVFTHDFLVNLMPEIHKISQLRFDQMEKKFKLETESKQVETFEVDLHMVFQQIFSEVIVRLFFGSQPTETLEGKNICEFINEIMIGIVKQLKSPLFNLFGEALASKGLKSKLKSFKQLARTLINKRLKEIESDKQKPQQPRDIIEALILSGQFSYKEHAEQANKELLTYDDLIGEFCTFFVAGMDTTSNFMASLVYQLAKQSSHEILEKMRLEVQTVLGEKQGEFLTYKDIKKMNFIEMVQKEGLRMFSPVNGIFSRKAVKSHYLKDIPIPVGMTIMVRTRPNFFKQEYFPDPFTFNPERWAQTNPNIHTYAYLPFSSGARTCIGNHLSLMESKIVLCELLSRYKKMTLQKENYKMVITFLYTPEKVMMRLQKQVK